MKRVPVFTFTAHNVLGKKLIDEGIIKTTDGANILKSKKYDCTRIGKELFIKISNPK